jgi:hypothetical protein
MFKSIFRYGIILTYEQLRPIPDFKWKLGYPFSGQRIVEIFDTDIAECFQHVQLIWVRGCKITVFIAFRRVLLFLVLKQKSRIAPAPQ